MGFLDSFSLETKIRIAAVLFGIIVCEIILGVTTAFINWQWLLWYAVLLVGGAEISRTPAAFFQGEGEPLTSKVRKLFSWLKLRGQGESDSESGGEKGNAENEVGFWTLMPSAFITWIFAKSIRNCSSLGGKYGIIGGVAYAGWYTSFITAAFVVYLLRTGRYKFTGLSSAINRVYGPLGAISFALAVSYRLFNEVWSNSIVVASFYGDTHSFLWWLAVIISTAIPVVYVVMGGMRSSLVSDVLQAGIAVIFLVLVVGYVSANIDGGFSAIFTTGNDWSFNGGLDLLVVALLQGMISYPFHDPVLTDRTFLSRPKTMLVSFSIGGSVAALFIVFFSAVGVYGKSIGIGGEPSDVTEHIGKGVFAITTLIMVSSSMSTLDSTFTSTAKLVALELAGWFRKEDRGPLSPGDENITRGHIMTGRIAILVMGVIGTLPLISETDALNATTISGTTVMGIGWPIIMMVFWQPSWKRAPLAFLLPFWFGVAFGISYQVKVDGVSALADTGLALGSGPYALLLGTNLWGAVICAGLWFVGWLIHQVIPYGTTVEEENQIENELRKLPSSDGSSSPSSTSSDGEKHGNVASTSSPSSSSSSSSSSSEESEKRETTTSEESSEESSEKPKKPEKPKTAKKGVKKTKKAAPHKNEKKSEKKPRKKKSDGDKKRKAPTPSSTAESSSNSTERSPSSQIVSSSSSSTSKSES